MPTPASGYKTLEGKPVPGVTTILGANLGWGTSALLHWAEKCGKEGKSHIEERDKAGRIGTITHARIEQDLGGADAEEKIHSPEEWAESEAPFKAFREWKEGAGVKVIHRELAIVSETYGFGGTLDLDAYLAGDRAIVDFKTSRTIHGSHIVQVAAYRILLKEFLGHRSPIARCVLLHLPRGCKKAKALTVNDKALEEGETVFRNLLRIHQAAPHLTPKAAFGVNE